MLTDNQSAPLILVVEDNDSHADLIRNSLEDAQEEYRLEIAGTLRTARAAIDRQAPDLVLADYRLPDGDGSELLLDAAGSWPVILMTSHGNEQVAVKAMKSGALDYIVKSPETFALLPVTVRHALVTWSLIVTRKKAEDALRESEKQYRQLFEGSRDGIVRVDNEGRFLDANCAYCIMLGYSLDELCAIPDFYSITPEKWREWEHEEIWNNRLLKQGFSGIYEKEYIRSDGSVFPVELQAFAVFDEYGEPLFLWAVVRDISDRKQAEEEQLSLERKLLQAQKMESLGVLAGGIAHDFNNILTSIVGNTDMALMRLTPESPVIENLKRIEKSAMRATDLAKQMLAYSGKGRFVIEAIDLNRLVEEMGHMLAVTISKKAVIRYNLNSPLPSVEVDATQIRQVVMNLVINASEAIGDKSGVIAISTGCTHCDRTSLKRAWLNSEIAEGFYVYLEVADTGCGMDQETRSKIFDPFFSTKFTGRGLGMAAVQGIVRGHKGAINVYSEPGKGSSFKILLPASEMPAELFNEKPVETGFIGVGTVLLVDDEETVREIGTEMLEELGFTVITANDGREALDALKANPDLFCVILDLTMPHLDGEQTFRELRTLDPLIKVIMSSGYSESEVTQRFAGEGLAGFIQKPYKISELREVLKGI